MGEGGVGESKREEAEGQGHGLNQNHNHHTINEFNFDFTLTLFVIWDNSDLCQGLLSTENFFPILLHIVDEILLLSLSLLFLSTQLQLPHLLVHRSPQSLAPINHFLLTGVGDREEKKTGDK